MKLLAVLLSFVFVVQVCGRGYGRVRKPLQKLGSIHPKPLGGVLPHTGGLVGLGQGGMIGVRGFGNTGVLAGGIRGGSGMGFSGFSGGMGRVVPGAFSGHPVAAQTGYGGRKPIIKDPILPKPFLPKQVDTFNGNGLLGLQGGSFGLQEDPAWIKRLLGSTVDGLPKIGGQAGFARHGGAGIGEMFANGLRDGFGATGLTDGFGATGSMGGHAAVTSWVDPLQGRQFPLDYAGGDLTLDPSSGHFIHKSAKSTGVVGGHIGSSVGHQIAKESSHNVAKSGFDLGVNTIGGGAQHNLLKQTGQFGGQTGQFGGQTGQFVGLPGQFVGQTGQFVGQTGQLGGLGNDHMAVKSGVATGVDSFSHNTIKAASSNLGGHGSSINIGGGVPFGVNRHIGNNPVHNVNKVVNSGLGSMNHDPLASNIGSHMAQKTIHQSAMAVDMGSNGGVSMGNPFASAAAAGLARESVHVAGKTLNMASSGGIRGGGVFGAGQFGVGIGSIPTGPIHPKPQVLPKVSAGGYGRRRRKPVQPAW